MVAVVVTEFSSMRCQPLRRALYAFLKLIFRGYMNPIDKITEPSFTSSTRGLLTLFCIGIFHIVIGVDLSNSKIAIPWFPVVELKNIERLIYLYWGLVFFASYRYIIHHLPTIRCCYFASLGEFFTKSLFGGKFIGKYIFNPKLSYRVCVLDNESLPKIQIENYQHGAHDFELMASFEIFYTEDYQFKEIVVTENSSYSMDSMAFSKPEIIKRWGFNEIACEYSNTLQTTRIRSKLLRAELSMFVYPTLIKNVLSNKDVFDLLIPLLLNIGLFLFWLTQICILDAS
ncbi:hypothetical protein ACW2Q6_003518, partial [Vibrio cholerae]